MKILRRGIAYSGENTPKYSSCSFPSICRLADGTILASFKAAERKIPDNKTDHAAVCISRDNAVSWSEPVEPFEPPVVDGKPTTIRTMYFVEVEPGNLLAVVNAVDATLEELPYYNEETEGLKETYILTAHSADGGRSFGELSRIQVESFYGMPLPLTGAPFMTGEGRVAIQFETNKHYYETEYWVHHSVLVFSEDGGYTWGNETVVTDNPNIYYWDQRASCLECGDIADIFWTFDRTRGDYINIHFTRSTDGGRSFGELTDTGLVGQPGNVIDGKDGSLLTVYINRDASPEIRLAKSYDGGRSWQDELIVYNFGKSLKEKQNAGMNDVWAEMGKFNVGHPFIERLADGTVMVYFYSGPSTHRTDFCYVMVEE